MPRVAPCLIACFVLAAPQQPATEPPPVERAVAWLVAAQAADGSWQPSATGTRHRGGITALAVLALLRDGRPGDRQAIDRGLGWLAAHRQPAEAYAHSLTVWALAEATRRLGEAHRTAAAAAIADLLAAQRADGGWGYAGAPDSAPAETCLAGLSLLALHAARAAGLDVAQPAVDRALALVRGRYLESDRLLHQDAVPSPSLAATAFGTAALCAWGDDSKVAKGCLAKLRQESLAPLPADLVGKPFKGYLRGKLLLEVWALAEAMRLGDTQRFAAWQPRLHQDLAARQQKDGSFAGWFGPAYGTALAVLAL